MDTKKIILMRPIKIAGTVTTALILREPNVVALKNISLHALQMGLTDQVISLLPMITEPKISREDALMMSAADVNKCAQAITGFLFDPKDDFVPTEQEETEAETAPTETEAIL